MSVNSRTIGKILTEACKENQALVVEGRAAQKDYLMQLRDRFKAHERIRYVGHGERYRNGFSSGLGRTYVSLTIRHKSGYGSYSLDFEFTDDNRLILSKSVNKENCPIGNDEDINRCIDIIWSLFEEADREKQKKDKINALKTTGIVAKLREIAAEDGFEYSYEQEKTRVKLLIKLDNRDALMILVPYKTFQETMQKIRPLIKTIRELWGQGISFKIQGFGRVRWSSEENEDD